jgi:uncharacterized hydrophobic protein (TIGR00271 family)
MSPVRREGSPVENRGTEQDGEHRLRGPWWYSERRSLSPEQQKNVLSQLYFEGPDLVPFLSRFAALMGMAVLIASFGLAQNSGPVVIGAMLVSPLTTPLLGLATALVLGHPRHQLSSLAILAGASVGGVGIAFVVMLILPEAQALTETSEQLLDRTTPDLLDLAVAVVAGAAGAYVLIRKEAISVLPGVAIAVALVPPIATIGMTLEIGRTDLADNALLLYATNLAGIILAAAFTMLLLGVTPKRTATGRLPRRIRLGLTTAAVGAVAVAVPLAEHTRRSVHNERDRQDAQLLSEQWLDGTDLRVDDVSVEGTDRLLVRVSGPSPPPAADELAEQLAAELEEDIELVVSWTPRRTRTITGTYDD